MNFLPQFLQRWIFRNPIDFVLRNPFLTLSVDPQWGHLNGRPMMITSVPGRDLQLINLRYPRCVDRGRVTVSADIHVHVVLLTVVEKWDGSIGALHAIEDNPRHGITPVVADADVVERLAVAVVDLE